MRTETRVRARALQMLYAWEMQGGPPIQRVTMSVMRWNPRQIACGEAAEALATAVVDRIADLDRQIGEAADNWRLDRIGAVERNILRIGLHELQESETPARVVISEAVRLAHWFAGSKAPAFVNGVLDSLARVLGRL
ncbi:MAG: transcription antitermination factor NusB [Gemmatimonadota bacterium]|nr:MAG: transcription antitermination factor NusB [Gemmatimonadota bacterium]